MAAMNRGIREVPEILGLRLTMLRRSVNSGAATRTEMLRQRTA